MNKTNDPNLERPVIGITLGDPAGIGAEICVKALARPEIDTWSRPVVIGDFLPLHEANIFAKTDLKIRHIDDPADARGEYGCIDLIDLHLLKKGDWEYKQVSAAAGEAAFQYVVKAIELAMSRQIDAVATGPINKAALSLAGHPWSGHTEIFAHYTQTKDYAMLLTTPMLRVIHVTTHVSMRQACRLIRRIRVLTVIRLAAKALQELGFARPRIGVAGLNAHSSEGGLFGNEEADEIIPAIRQAQAEGILVEGPVPPDTVFVKAVAGQYDVVVAMYHDQGHIPLKLLGFKIDPQTRTFTAMQGVNITVGLPIIRTSVDHGTAFEKAGEGRANEQSLVDAIETAVAMTRHRKGRLKAESQGQAPHPDAPAADAK